LSVVLHLIRPRGLMKQNTDPTQYASEIRADNSTNRIWTLPSRSARNIINVELQKSPAAHPADFLYFRSRESNAEGIADSTVSYSPVFPRIRE